MDPKPQKSDPRSAAEGLLEETYERLREVAAQRLRDERRDHTLQPTALVHEVFLRLRDQRMDWQGRSHFLGVAAHAMRRVLIDHARTRGRAKRPSSGVRVTLTGLLETDSHETDALALHEALEKLASLDPRAARVAELRGLAGCTTTEAAQLLDVSVATVERDWRMARSWLRRELT